MTVAAISTPAGEGAIALIRISGPDALRVLGAVYRGTVEVAAMKPRHAYFGRIEDAGVLVDEVLVIVFKGPSSYTGEDMAEISCHGGILLAGRILEMVLHAGAQAAEPGEFTRRAFVNGKLDLTQAEAVMDLIRARTPRALRAAAEQLAGGIGVEIEAIRGEILESVAHIEAWIDFPEEGIDPETGGRLIARLERTRDRVAALLATAGEGRILREGVRLAIAGKPNAGKSSLLNRLLGFDRAIVSPVAGTTRDTIEELANLRGVLFRITDTAGLRESEDAVEREGVQRARKSIESADLILHVVDARFPEDDLEHWEQPTILVFNKIDLLPESAKLPPDSAGISCETGAGIEALVENIVSRVGVAHLSAGSSLAAVNARHQALLEAACASIEASMAALRDGLAPEFAAFELREALASVGGIVGALDTEDILGKIFSDFCIGK